METIRQFSSKEKIILDFAGKLAYNIFQKFGEVMINVTEDVLRFLDTMEVPSYWTQTNEHFDDFIRELDLQEQINETELTWDEE